MSFLQQAPQLTNQYEHDRVLRGYLQRHLPPDLQQLCEAELEAMGRAAVELSAQQLRERRQEPTLTHFDGWGQRIDHIELTPLWRKAHNIAAQAGLIATAYEGNYQPYGRLVQFALVYLFHPSSDVFSCPLAMTDGAARALLDSGNQTLIQRAVTHLTSREPKRFWTSGQWMTETTGGSDVGRSETVAVQTGGDEHADWSLHGKKWFTSAATSQMALTLARPRGNPDGSRGLALFYVEPRNPDNQLQNIQILRLKDKLGTRKLPTAELILDGTPATLVGQTTDGVKAIAPMLNITRTWNAVCAIGYMRRAIALARDYSARRQAFGRRLIDLPLHQLTLARLQAEFEACFHLTFHVVQMLGLAENGQLTDNRERQLRLLIPVTKLLTGKSVVAICSEAIECFGGAGYVEDTGLPQLLRDAQVLPIWEGTTNVLSLDVLRVLRDEATLKAWLSAQRKRIALLRDPALSDVANRLKETLKQLNRWLRQAESFDDDQWQLQARDLAITLGKISAATLLADQAQHDWQARQDQRPLFAVRLFIEGGLTEISTSTTTTGMVASAAAVLATDLNPATASDSQTTKQKGLLACQ